MDCQHWRATKKTPFGGGECAIGAYKDPSFGTCARCEKRLPIPGHVEEPLVELTVPQGVGTELGKLIRRLGISQGKSCGCAELVQLYDMKGIAWCEEHSEEIIAKLKENAKKRSWLLGLGAKLTAAKLLDMAIANAKKAIALRVVA